MSNLTANPLITRAAYLIPTIQVIRGGSGSGNWGHTGRPGKKGGSGKGGGLSAIGVKPDSSVESRRRASAKRKKQGKKATGKQKELGQRSQEMADFENKHATAKNESAALYDKDGNELFQIGGQETEVTFSDDQLSRMKGGVLTHNHPNTIGGKTYSDGGSFSESDVELMASRELSEVRAVTENYVYIMRPKIVHNNNLSQGAISESRRQRDKVKSALDKDFRAGKVSRKDYPLEFHHRKWQAVADAGFVEYERIKR